MRVKCWRLLRNRPVQRFAKRKSASRASSILLVNPSEAGELRQRALTLAQSINDKWRTAHTFFVSSWGYHDRYSYVEKALALFQEVGDLRYMADCMTELGRLEILNNDLETAQKRLHEAMDLFRQLNIKTGIADILQGYGWANRCSKR